MGGKQMKKFKIVFFTVLLMGFFAGPAMAQLSYDLDFLEMGNPGGIGTCNTVGTPCSTDLDCFGGAFACENAGQKTYDTTWTLDQGQTVEMDIWLSGLPAGEDLLTSGCFITYDPSQVSISSVMVYDTAATPTPGLWDAGSTSSFLVEPGQWFIALAQFGCVDPYADGTVAIARVMFEGQAGGTADIVVSTVPDFDTNVTCTTGVNLDSQTSSGTTVMEVIGAGCQSDLECDNGIFCDGAETCNTGTGECENGTPPDCDDLVACTDDICDTGQDICVNTPNDSFCDDDLFCNGVESCDPVNDCQDGMAPDCDDNVGCTVDTCDEVGDTCVNTPDDLACDDADVCNGEETCDPINDCQPGDPLVCDDGDLCTTDSCDALDGCIFSPVECPVGEECDPADGQCKAPAECEVDADCDDGEYCNGEEICDMGTCMPGTPPDCDDNVGCTADSCDEVEDICVNTPDDGACDDADVCTGTETCDPVNDCQPGNPLVCDDGNLCTTDSCDPVAGCIYTPVECPVGEQCDPADGQCKVPAECEVDADCDDGLYCNGEEICDMGTCIAGTPPNCDDGVGCTADSCDEVGDSCVNAPDDGACDDADVCNGAETCDPELDCQPGDPLVCEDGDLCTNDNCDPSDGCIFSPVVCSPGEECDPADGQCKPLPGCEVDADCDDGQYCNGEEICDTGVGECFPGTPPDCNDYVDCTVDTCDEVEDTCVNTPEDSLCDDGDVCNGMETCDAVDGCQPGDPLNCDDGVGCTDDTCDPVAGCRNSPNDDNCPDDGVYCNGEELCDPVNDCYSTGDPCPSGTECNEETQSCDAVGGLMVYVDIDPYNCPNKLNLESPYKVRVTILGTEDLDVTAIDPASLMLSREGADAGVPVARVGGVGDVRFDYKDRSTPYDGKLCKCPDCDIKDACGTDGYMDISAYFKISELVEVLKLDEVAGQRVTLMLTGMLREEFNGTSISGKDCVDVMAQCKGDFDCDGDVDGGDTNKMKKNFGWEQEDGTCDGDFDKDGDVDSTDINAFKKVFGNSPLKGSPCGFEECKGDFDCDTDVDGQDAKKFTEEFGRSSYSHPCTDDDVCIGDFDNDEDCDGKDAAAFKSDFGRGQLKDPCKGCVVQ
jgi:hypothetical protein